MSRWQPAPKEEVWVGTVVHDRDTCAVIVRLHLGVTDSCASLARDVRLSAKLGEDGLRGRQGRVI